MLKRNLKFYFIYFLLMMVYTLGGVYFIVPQLNFNTGAIVFGNLEDEDGLASKLARSRRSFRLLDGLGTGPAVIYLKGGETNV